MTINELYNRMIKEQIRLDYTELRTRSARAKARAKKAYDKARAKYVAAIEADDARRIKEADESYASYI